MAPKAPPSASSASIEPATPAHWADQLVDERRDVVVRANPRDLYEDPVFGGMLKRGVDVAIGEAHARGAIGQALEVLARASDISVAVREREGRDVVAILYGVSMVALAFHLFHGSWSCSAEVEGGYSARVRCLVGLSSATGSSIATTR